MLKTKPIVVAVSALFVLVSAYSIGCAHPQTVTLTSASAVAPPPPASRTSSVAPAEAVAAPSDATEAEEAKMADVPAASASKPRAKTADGEPMTFAELSAALGDGEKMGIELEHSTAPAGKGLSADGYAAVGAPHQAVDTGSGVRAAGDIKLSGGMSAAAVRAGVHEGAGRLRACYEHGLVADPRLAGRVLVSFSVDEHGAVSDVGTETDTLPAELLSCVRDAFSAMTFAPPKTAPAKIVYPVDFNKDS